MLFDLIVLLLLRELL